MKAKIFGSSLIVSAMLACASITPAMAQHADTPMIDQAQQQIRARIQQGVASGHITEHEAHNLYQREREIQMREARMKRDGVAGPDERRHLRQDLEDLHVDVDRKMSNRRVSESHGVHTPGIDRQQHQIHARIENGIRSGHITPIEADRLFARERRLQSKEARFKMDGYISRDERRELHQQVAMLSDDVDRMLNNDRRRWNAR